MLSTTEITQQIPNKEKNSPENEFLAVLIKKNIEKMNAAIKTLKALKEFKPQLKELLTDSKTKLIIIIAALGLIGALAGCSPIDVDNEEVVRTYQCSPEFLDMSRDNTTAPIRSGDTWFNVLQEDAGLHPYYSSSDGKVAVGDVPVVLGLEKQNYLGEYGDPSYYEASEVAKRAELNTNDRLSVVIVEALCGQTVEPGKVLETFKAEQEAAEQAAYEAAQYNYQETVKPGDNIGTIYQRLMETYGFEYDEGDYISVFDKSGKRKSSGPLGDYMRNLADGHIEEGWTVEVDSRNVP